MEMLHVSFFNGNEGRYEKENSLDLEFFVLLYAFPYISLNYLHSDIYAWKERRRKERKSSSTYYTINGPIDDHHKAKQPNKKKTLNDQIKRASEIALL